MRLQQQIDRQLERLRSQGARSRGAQLIAQDAGGRFACELDAVDAIGCAVRRAEYSTDRLADASIDQLRRIADQLASQLTYLLEPVRVVEWDEGRGEVQLRSRPPFQEKGESCYYELIVHRGGVRLRRYAAGARPPRRVIAAQVTREVLGRLAEDLARSAQLPPRGPRADKAPPP